MRELIGRNGGSGDRFSILFVCMHTMSRGDYPAQWGGIEALLIAVGAVAEAMQLHAASC